MTEIDFQVNWSDGWSNFKKMYKDPSSTKHILALAKAVNGPYLKKSYDRLLSTGEGTAIALSLPEIPDLYSVLPECPDHSVGNVVLHNQAYPIETLVRLSKLGTRNRAWINRKHPYVWMARRYRDTHDFWHTLTGYQMDFFGEICLAAFTYAQTGATQWGLVALMGIAKLISSPRQLLAVFEAYYRGKRCKWLLAEDYEKMIHEDITECRVRLKLHKAILYDSITKN